MTANGSYHGEKTQGSLTMATERKRSKITGMKLPVARERSGGSIQDAKPIAPTDGEFLIIEVEQSGKPQRYRASAAVLREALRTQLVAKAQIKSRTRLSGTRLPASKRGGSDIDLELIPDQTSPLADAAQHLASVLQLDEDSATELLRDLAREQGRRDSSGRSSLSEHEQKVLREAGVVLPEFDLPFAERPSVQSKIRRAQIAAEALTTSAVAERLHVSTSRVRQRAADRSLFALPSGENETRRFPTFQFTDDGELPNWGVVARAIPGGTSPVAVEAFLNTPQVDLQDPEGGDPLTPRMWLELHLDAQPVAELVAGFSTT